MSLPRNTLKRRIAPGIWEDQEGGVHWSIPELLALADLADTPANRKQVEDMIAEVTRIAAPEAMIIRRDKPD